MKSVTYLVYIIMFETLVLGGCGYVVFVLGHSGWWFVLAVVLSVMAYRPIEWIHGIKPSSGEGSECEQSTSKTREGAE